MANSDGWIKLYRKMLENPTVWKDPDHIAIWIYLLLQATHQEWEAYFGGQKITLRPGQLITGRKKIAEGAKVDEDKVRRVLKNLKNDQQITQRSEPYGSLITILAWDEYQQNTQQNTQRVPNEYPTSAHYTRIKEHKNKRSVCVKRNTVSNSIQGTRKKAGDRSEASPAGDRSEGKGKRPHTHPFGKFGNVYLTEKEEQDVRSTYQNPKKLIDKASIWLTEHERKNHYALILKFADADDWPRKPQQTAQPKAKAMTAKEKAEAEAARRELMAKVDTMKRRKETKA